MNEINEQIFRQIKSEFALRGLKWVDIARDLGCTRSWVNQVAMGIQKNIRVRQAIAEAIGKDPWGENGN
jgi:hypothetical protein